MNEKMEKLKGHSLWLQLTPHQQNFLTIFVESEDARKAASEAYKCKSPRSADAMAAKQFRNWKVRRVLSSVGEYNLDGALLGKPEAKQLLSDRLRSTTTEDPVFLKMMQLYIGLSGWMTMKQLSSPDKPVEPSDFNQLVREMEQKRQKSG